MSKDQTPGKHRVQVRYGPELYNVLERQAVVERRPVAEIVRDAVRDYLDRREHPPRLPA